MATRRAAGPLRGLVNSAARSGLPRFHNASTPSITRSIATEAALPASSTPAAAPPISSSSIILPANPKLYPSPIPEHIRPATVNTTIYRFPNMEPLRFAAYPSSHLFLPLRRDLLHRAVVYEGDSTRQGTAQVKYRSEVHGSNRKIRPQKGMGRARLGDKKSPMLRGGGVAFGPRFRDFATDLPRKIYDQAWRIALSYRYRRGELIVVEDEADLERNSPSYVREVFGTNGWGRANGRSMVITADRRENLFTALQGAGDQGSAKTWTDVDVKNLLETGRLIVEKGALDLILEHHQTDMMPLKVNTAFKQA